MIGSSSLTKRAVEPPVFSGDDNKDAASWIRKFDLYSRSIGWSEDDRLDFVELFLDAKALRWYERSRNRTEGWAGLREEFIRKFNSAESELRAWRELQNTRQSTNEELEDFIYKLEMLFEKTNIINGEIKFKCLLSSISPKYQEAIVKSRVVTYIDAVRVALESETMENTLRRDIQDINDNGNNNSDISNIMEEIKEMKKLMLKTNKQKNDYTALNKKPYINKQNERQVGEQRKNNNCYTCGEEGHFSNSCPKRAWNLRSDEQSSELKPQALHCMERHELPIRPETISDNGMELYNLDIMWKELSIVEKRKLLNQDRTEKVKNARLEENSEASRVENTMPVQGNVTEPISNINWRRNQGTQLSIPESKLNKGYIEYSIKKELDNMKANISMGQLIRASPVIRNELGRLCKKPENSHINTIQSEETSNCKTTVCIGGQTCTAVIDTGAACCVITQGTAKRLGLVANTKVNEVILTADGKHHYVSNKISDVPVEVKGIRFDANLLQMEGKNESLVLGTDWLKTHAAVIDLNTLELILPVHEDSLVVPLELSKDKDKLRNEVMISIAKEVCRVENAGADLVTDSRISELLEDNKDILANDLTELEFTDVIEHEIETGNNAPIKLRPYRVPQAMKQLVREELSRMETAGVIEACKSDWATPASTSDIPVKSEDEEDKECITLFSMEMEKHRAIMQYLSNKTYPEVADEEAKKKIRLQSTRYTLNNGTLYSYSKKFGRREVLTEQNALQKIKLVHDHEHTGISNTWEKVKLCWKDRDNWDRYLWRAMLIARTMKHRVLGVSPSKMLYGSDMRTPVTWNSEVTNENEEEALRERLKFVEVTLPVIRDLASQKVIKNKKYEIQRYNKKVIVFKFKLLDKVLKRVEMPTSKFSASWEGPYTVVRVLERGTYIIRDKENNLDQVNGDRLKPYRESEGMIPDVAPSTIRPVLRRFKDHPYSNRDDRSLGGGLSY
ncbi:hypothetical protein AX774_g3639 [Zancudomyces culisetae]|uniref:CCHC-type domain-containing protein n=1 Tax=Zancudomyces culisetae TaxID=1213189 RepID=A0A1R1PPJ4_ZANCU|nr:hypothetical protein AX774_g3639 [Zancudomyces culisetae]|eukprot:OMH82870.1 hypothetical protein AX774_g3639 [Zancudomyces culisetae]